MKSVVRRLSLRKFLERIRVYAMKNPSRTILIFILLLNLILFAVAAAVISALAPKSIGPTGFWASIYYTISMIFDAGCIQYVVEDIGQVSVVLIIVCLLTVLIGMITFTGAVIGYVTNVISNFIENAKSGSRALRISGHTVILNWNSRASEIINDLLYTGKREVVIILVSSGGDAVKREIEDRISASLRKDQRDLIRECEQMPLFRRIPYYHQHKTRNRVSVIVREGETYSTKQLTDISLFEAKSIILLAKEAQNEICRYGNLERLENLAKGNANTIKTLVQVADMTASEDSADDQIIIVEVEDPWTASLVDRIAEHKAKEGKCTIIPVYVNRVLGQILSQFSIMPELNTVYSDLFSNRGAEFFSKPSEWVNDRDSATREYMRTHRYAIPLTILKTASGNNAYCVANYDEDCERSSEPSTPDFRVTLNPNYSLSCRNVVIVGHNSKSADIMNGFSAFRGEHNKDRKEEILNITVIDDPKSLERLNNYADYPYVTKIVPADVYDSAVIRRSLEEAIDSHEGDTSILILSDDGAQTEDIDSAALTYLIYVQDIIQDRSERIVGFDKESIDVVVEILNPKNYDVVHNYSVNNVVISNRYISKMVTQIGRKQELFEFYSDILTYDDEGSERFESKELYIKEVKDFFAPGCIPGPCTARELIWAVFEASPKDNKAVVLGYTSPGNRTVLFAGNQDEIPIRLTDRDKLIVFSSH